MEQSRFWDGKTVHFASKGLGGIFDRRKFELGLTEDTARKLALALARLKQTTFALNDETQEVLDALNYVLVADPASVRAHRALEAGKGMTPDGGYRAPDPREPGEFYAGGMPGKASQIGKDII